MHINSMSIYFSEVSAYIYVFFKMNHIYFPIIYVVQNMQTKSKITYCYNLSYIFQRHTHPYEGLAMVEI